MAADEFCCGFNDDVCAVFEGTIEIWRSKRVVNNQQKAVCVCNFRQGIDVDEVDVGIADRFNIDGLRLVVDFPFKIGKVVRIDEVSLDAKRIKRRVEEVERAPVNC